MRVVVCRQYISAHYNPSSTRVEYKGEVGDAQEKEVHAQGTSFFVYTRKTVLFSATICLCSLRAFHIGSERRFFTWSLWHVKKVCWAKFRYTHAPVRQQRESEMGQTQLYDSYEYFSTLDLSNKPEEWYAERWPTENEKITEVSCIGWKCIICRKTS